MELEDPFIAKQAEKSARWTTTHRVNGELAVSRGIGDPDYKGTDICGLIHEILLLIDIIDRCVCLQAKGCRSTFGAIRKVTPKNSRRILSSPSPTSRFVSLGWLSSVRDNAGLHFTAASSVRVGGVAGN